VLVCKMGRGEKFNLHRNSWDKGKRSSDITEATIERLIICNQPMVFTF